MFLLSICVPTYNRCEKLNRQLNFILNEISDLKNIELIVSDNASVDETRFLEILNNNKIKSHRNSKNLGLVGNLYTLAQLASGKYIWFVGDDDNLIQGAIKNVISSLAHESTFLFLNHSILDGNTGTCLYKEVVDIGTEVFQDGKDSIKEIPFNLISQLMFITACVYRKDNLLEIMAPDDNLAAPLRYSFYCASRGTSLIIRKHCLVNYWGNTSWEAHASKIRQVFIPEIFFKLPKYGYKISFALKLLVQWYLKNWRETLAYNTPNLWRSIQYIRLNLKK